MTTYLHWFRNDLRLHDQPALADLPAGSHFLGLYFLEPHLVEASPADPAAVETAPWGWPRMSSHRLRFLRQSLSDLKSSLQARGSDLIVLQGEPAAGLRTLAGLWPQVQLTWQREHTREELDAEQALRRSLAGLPGLNLQSWEGIALLHPDDLPFGPLPRRELPDVFTAFRKMVEPVLPVREPLLDPEKPLRLPERPFDLNRPPGQDARTPWSALTGCRELDPTHDEDWPLPQHPLWPEAAAPDPRSAFPFSGGRASGLERLRSYVQADGPLRTYKATRNGLVGADYSSKLSPWLANGCLSARQVYRAVREHEATFGANDSTYWLIFELLWRDFFRFQAIKQGDRLFAADGVQRKRGVGRGAERRSALGPGRGAERRSAPRGPSPETKRAFERWAAGRTGQPFIDANMRELAATGWMSNRGRQNAASYLVHDLGLDWRMGASWFEALLMDYDVASNWGNWQYAAGVGLDPRSQGSGQRRFNPEKQAAQYDPDGEFVRLWS
jgi:deoxyribodipyrimidine photo-lyase